MTTISIICPYRDSEKFLRQLYANVRQQTFADWELLLINDDSSDSGPEIAAELATQDNRVHALTAPRRGNEDDSGPWWPRNFGIIQSNGQFIAFLDVDDLWHPYKLQLQIHQITTLGSDMSITGYARFRENREELSRWMLPPYRITYKRLLNGNAIPLLTVIIKRELVSEGFRPSRHEDYLFWLDIFKSHPTIVCLTIPALLAFHQRHKESLTSCRLQMASWAYKVYRNHGYSRLLSLIRLIPWSMTQLSQQIRSSLNPLRSMLSDALGAKSPIVLPPSRFS